MVYQWEVGTVRCPICSKSLFQVLSLNFFLKYIYKDVIKIKTFENISCPQKTQKKKIPKMFLLSKEYVWWHRFSSTFCILHLDTDRSKHKIYHNHFFHWCKWIHSFQLFNYIYLSFFVLSICICCIKSLTPF